MAKIKTVVDVVDALGGRHAVAELCGVTYNAVSNWCSWDRFPARLHLVIARECGHFGVDLPDNLFEATETARRAS